ncbi:MAG: DNA polymerase III subunit alpha [Bacteroidetes bacterium]|nr:MAG: DNA polymerase III subunit alpha [Bacteroidota bacterium]
MKFSHLHVHTQYSLLDGAADIGELYKKAVEDKMPAIAITDHGNMFGVFSFVAEALKYNTKENPDRIKPIVGCEFYLVQDRHKKQFTKDDKDQRYHQLMLAKNAEGYKNLVKLCSLGYIEGMYSKYPRIDKELILKYHKGLIATTCCLAAEVPRTILRKGEAEAEKAFQWWMGLFGEDYYVEIQRHGIPEQNKVNEVLLKFSKKYNVKIIASNDSHYVNVEDSNAHDILLCINTGEKQSTPSAKDFDDDDSLSKKGKRFAFFNDQFFLKSSDEMKKLFSDVPEAIDNTNEIVSKIEMLKLKQDVLLPNFPIPQKFQIHTKEEKINKDVLTPDSLNQWEYLKHLTFEGAKKRYSELTKEIEDRINFELFTIKTMGFAGYFLIVSDFIKAGRDMGVYVGPGRGSAAGSVVAYCTGITNIDPIKYNLLFERFLNPERKSMPDIDTDFDDEGRQKVLNYVVEKYGKNQVAQIVTYGTMAAKMSIKDVARVMDLPLNEANLLAKFVPERAGIELNRVILAPMTGPGSITDKDKENLSSDEIESVKKLREIYKGDNLQAKVLKEAVILEGSVRGTGVHAAGIIIAPKDLMEIIPVATAKDSELYVTQYEGTVVESAGVLKMDFLGLKTLTIMRDTLRLIKEHHGKDIDIENIPLDDKKTLELYQRGETNGTFQFESPGMQKHLKDLKPDKFDDLIAMNALYRPGPIQYIPNYIARKHGREKISYDLPEMEEILKDTYGVTVYQEQVMLLSQSLAGFSKGDADVLRKAMGKKDKKTLTEKKSQFIEGATEKGFPAEKLEKIWTDWEAFAQYAFNKSHSTCYALVAFQTAYLKTHYPAEFMACVLTHHLSNIDKIAFFMEESRRMGMPVLGPDVNESEYQFSVNDKGAIRFGLGAVKGVGEAAVSSIIQERKKNGAFRNALDFVKRVNLRAANKKTFEGMVYSGAFDSFGLPRSTYLTADKDGIAFLEMLLKWGGRFQESKLSAHASLFGDSSDGEIPEPTIPVIEPWGNLEQLKFERDVIGFYVSGHPLDNFKIEMETFSKSKLSELRDMDKMKGKEFSFGGMISMVNHRISKTGKPFGNFTLEDYGGSHEFVLFGEDYVKNKLHISIGYFVHIKGRVQERWNQSDMVEFRITSMQLLSEMREKMLKSITLNVPIKDISDKFIQNLDTLVKENTKEKDGTCYLKFNIMDSEEGIALMLPSRKVRVNPDNSFLSTIERMPNVTYKLN